MYKHNVAKINGKHDFFDVLQWIERNTNWTITKRFMKAIRRDMVDFC